VNPEPFLQLDRVIHEKGRLAIMSALAASPGMTFRDLRDLLEMTDGNVTAHLRTLHDAGYVAVTKAIESGKTLTSYSITLVGRKAFSAYLGFLEQILSQTRNNPPKD
jgi:DNA-binding MarR family transcriptional regulator